MCEKKNGPPPESMSRYNAVASPSYPTSLACSRAMPMRIHLGHRLQSLLSIRYTWLRSLSQLLHLVPLIRLSDLVHLAYVVFVGPFEGQSWSQLRSEVFLRRNVPLPDTTNRFNYNKHGIHEHSCVIHTLSWTFARLTGKSTENTIRMTSLSG